MRLSVLSKVFLVLTVSVICSMLAHPAGAVSPSPSPSPAGPAPVFTEVDCGGVKIQALSGDVRRVEQQCISFEDRQSGFPYHPCNIIRDPLTGVYTQLMEAGKTMISGMLPAIIANSPIFNSIFDNNIASAKVLNGTLLNTIPSALFDAAPNKPADMATGFGLQYHAGCVLGNICAQSRDLSSLGVIGDNLCVPETEWGTYINMKIDELTGPKKVVGGAGALQLIDIIVKNLRASANSEQAALSILCFRSTPNGDRILNAIVDDNMGSKLLPLAIALIHPAGAAGVAAMRQSIIDRYMNLPTFGTYIKNNTPKIITIVNTPLIGIAPDLFPSYKVQESEMTSLARCISAAQDSKLFTAIGNIPVDNLGNFISTFVFTTLFGIAGATTLLCVIYCAIMIQMSAGGESMGKARDTLMHCLMGLALIIFATFLLRFIGVDLLRLPGLS
ncbi:MAG: hypothetical protein WCO78_00940 [Candidatus Roizmanbacteria bacterium]